MDTKALLTPKKGSEFLAFDWENEGRREKGRGSHGAGGKAGSPRTQDSETTGFPEKRDFVSRRLS